MSLRVVLCSLALSSKLICRRGFWSQSEFDERSEALFERLTKSCRQLGPRGVALVINTQRLRETCSEPFVVIGTDIICPHCRQFTLYRPHYRTLCIRSDSKVHRYRSPFANSLGTSSSLREGCHQLALLCLLKHSKVCGDVSMHKAS